MAEGGLGDAGCRMTEMETSTGFFAPRDGAGQRARVCSLGLTESLCTKVAKKMVGAFIEGGYSVGRGP